MAAETVTSGPLDHAEPTAHGAHVEGGPELPRWRRPVPSWLLFAVVMVGAAAVVLLHNRWVFSEPISAEGDFGLNGLLAEQAKHFSLWEGNYSRVGFHHPGPALLYVMMVGSVVGHSWLHLAPAATNGMILGQIVFDAALLGAVALVVRRLTGSALGGIAVAGLVLMPIVRIGGAANPWPPFQYMPAFALFVVAAAAVAGGITRAVTAYVVGAGLIAHGQVSFLLFVAVTTVVVAAGWWWAHRREVRATVAEHRRRLLVAAGVLALFLLPLVLQTVFHHGGPWRDYAAYSTGSGAQHNGLGPSARWLVWFVWNSGIRIPFALAAVVVTALLAVTERDRVRRRQIVAFLVVAALEAALVLFFAMRGVDGLTQTNRYLTYFALVLTPIVVGVAAALLGVRVAAVLGRFTGVQVARLATGGVAAALVVAFLAWLVPDPAVQSPYRGVPAVGMVTKALDDDPARTGRPVSFELENGLTTFAYTAGVVFELEQQGVESCVWSKDPSQQELWAVVFTDPYTCNPSDLSGTWQLAVQDAVPASPTSPTSPTLPDAVYDDGAVAYYPRTTTG